MAQDGDALAGVRALYSERQYADVLAEADRLRGGDDPELVRQATLWTAHCHRALRQYEDAISLYGQLAEGAPPDGLTIDALVGLADALQLTGRLDESERVLSRATQLYPDVTEARLEAAGSSLYSRNRAQYETVVDFTRGQLRKLASRCESAGDSGGALLAWRQIYRAYPDHPDARNVALHLADRLREQGQTRAAVLF